MGVWLQCLLDWSQTGQNSLCSCYAEIRKNYVKHWYTDTMCFVTMVHVLCLCAYNIHYVQYNSSHQCGGLCWVIIVQWSNRGQYMYTGHKLQYTWVSYTHQKIYTVKPLIVDSANKGQCIKNHSIKVTALVPKLYELHNKKTL